MIRLRQVAWLYVSLSFALLTGCGSAEKPVANSPNSAQSAPNTPDSTINYELLGLQKNAAEMRASGSGQEGAALQETETKIQQLQSQIQMENGAGK